MTFQSEHGDLLALCTRAAKAAADVIRAAVPGVRTLNWQSKGPTDFVTEVDLAAEDAILEIVRRERPAAVVLAEETAAETAPERVAKGVALVIDPLDGTTNFLHGYPEYGVSIAALIDGVPVAAIVYDIPGEEIFTAMKGAGARVNGSPCKVSSIKDPHRALIGTGFPYTDPDKVAPYQAQMSRVMAHVAGIRRPGAASIDLASVASGRFDAFWENRLSAWDFAAGMLLVTEAGGIVSDVEGNPLSPHGPSGVLAGGPAMYEWLRATLAGEP